MSAIIGNNFEFIRSAKIKNFDKKPKRGGIPAIDKKSITSNVLIKVVDRKNLYSFRVLKLLKSNKKNIAKKQANSAP